MSLIFPPRPLAAPPGAQSAAQVDQLAQVVGIMVRHQKCFTQDRLAFTVWNPGEQVPARALDKTHHRFQVRLKGADALIPGARAGWGIRGGPVTRWPFGRDVLWVAAEFENVP